MENVLETSLTSEHIRLGAKMAPFAGFNMPLQYSSVKEEVIAVRNKSGVFDVSHMGEFFVTGPEAIKFVDYALTNDFAAAAEGKAVYSPLCRKDGTVIDDLIAYKLESEKVLICVNASNIEKDFKWLSSLSIDFNCEIKDHSNDYSLLALQGPDSQNIISKLNIDLGADFDYYSARELQSSFGELIVARTGYTGEDGFEIFGSHETVRNLWSDLLNAGVTPCGLASRDVLRLEVAYPLYGHEIHDDVTPLDAALKWTVKASKDSFMGKEALESYSPKFRLVKLSLEKGIPREGYAILNNDEEQIGTITSGTMSVTLGYGIGIGLVEKDKFPKDKEFKIQVRKNAFAAKYHAKAFVTGGHK